jgi:hypothetical protein
MRQLLCAVGHLHGRGVAHRDIKPDNVLLMKPEAGMRDNILRLGDLGFAARFNVAAYFDDLPPFSQRCGTPAYLAPEVLAGARYGSECDLWSAGVVAYQLLSAREPFQGEIEQILAEQERPLCLDTDIWKSTSMAAKDLVMGLLMLKVSQRFKPRQALEMEWLRLKTPILPQWCCEHHLERALKQLRELSMQDQAGLALLAFHLQGSQLESLGLAFAADLDLESKVTYLDFLAMALLRGLASELEPGVLEAAAAAALQWHGTGSVEVDKALQEIRDGSPHALLQRLKESARARILEEEFVSGPHMFARNCVTPRARPV